MNSAVFTRSLLIALMVSPGPWAIGLRADVDPATIAAGDPRRDATVVAVERVLPSVVNIATRTWIEREHPYEKLWRQFYGYQRQPEASYSRGSGVVVNEDGYILTNTHVVADADDIWVQFFNEPDPIPAERVVLSKSKDVAVLKLKPKTPRKFRAIPFAQEDDLLLGETVITLGNPFGLGASISRGILSSKTRRAPADLGSGAPLDIADWLQTDASINPGNSGGPLINLRGELIGLNVAVLSPSFSQGIGFAIPVKQINAALAETLSGESIGGFWFGAHVSGAKAPLLVQMVEPNSPAAVGGLRRGDTIRQLNGKAVDSLIDFNQELVRARDDQDVRLTVGRDGEIKVLKVRLVDERRFFNNDVLWKRLGLRVRAASPGGFVVDTIEPGGPAAKADIRKGMLIASVDGTRVDSVVQLARAAHSKPQGDKVTLNLVWGERRGPVVYRTEGEAEVKVR
ncbi:MAG TPA: trypsin-like peptidase domain-containing protein [Verrucomicrobiota bacterium]|nr:trypsin-like peptidase domain-containing protein [Verrucomicrobiota bacterium]